MNNVFLFCAVLGSMLVLLQFAATLFGLSGQDLADGADGCDADFGDAGADAADVGSEDGGVEFLKAFSFRTLTAGLAFFGLAGLAAQSAGLERMLTLGIATFSGFVAIVAVYFLMRTLASFRGDGSIRPSTAAGSFGSVYLRIPAKRGGFGKAIVEQQGRSMEYEAATDEENELPTGTPIVVVKPLSPTQMLVARRRD